MPRAFRESATRYRFRMSLDRNEFLRDLPGAVAQAPFDRAETADGTLVLTGRPPGRPWRIRAAPLPPLRLGALVLPRLELVLDLAGHSAEEAEAFAIRFLSQFQRAGG
jgi:hypothetical protein